MTELIDFRKFIRVSGPLPGDDGDQINIALLDSGLNVNHADLNRSAIRLGNIHNSWDEVNDVHGHGTKMGGLICADSGAGNGITGLVPKATITVFKVLRDDGSVNIDNISKALSSIADSGDIDLVNMSFNVTEPEYKMLKPAIEKIHHSGIIMVGAAGNGEILASRCFYPAISEFIFSVGSINHESFAFFKTHDFYRSVDYFFLNEKLSALSHINNSYSQVDLCSAYTAIVSGLIARILSTTLPKTDRFRLLASKLNQLASPYRTSNALEPGLFYKTI